MPFCPWYHGKIQAPQARPHKSSSTLGPISKQQVYVNIKKFWDQPDTAMFRKNNKLTPKDTRTSIQKVQLNPKTAINKLVQELDII